MLQFPRVFGVLFCRNLYVKTFRITVNIFYFKCTLQTRGYIKYSFLTSSLLRKEWPLCLTSNSQGMSRSEMPFLAFLLFPVTAKCDCNAGAQDGSYALRMKSNQTP